MAIVKVGIMNIKNGKKAFNRLVFGEIDCLSAAWLERIVQRIFVADQHNICTLFLVCALKDYLTEKEWIDIWLIHFLFVNLLPFLEV